MFVINDSDSVYIKDVKEEFNIAIKRNLYDENTLAIVYKIIETITDLTLDIITCPNSLEDILKLVERSIDNTPITPVDLINDKTIKGCDNTAYKRYPYLIVENNNRNTRLSIYNTRAYNIHCNIEYYTNTKTFRKLKCPIITYPYKVYIIENGVLTNKYIEKCYVKGTQFYPNSIVNLDCVQIHYEGYNANSIFAVKNTSSKFKALCKFYDVPVNVDDTMEEINLKQYKKLTK